MSASPQSAWSSGKQVAQIYACESIKNASCNDMNHSLDHQSGHMYHKMHFWDDASIWIDSTKLIMVIINKNIKQQCPSNVFPDDKW